MMLNQYFTKIFPLFLLLGFYNLPFFSSSALAQTTQCTDREEVFGFQLDNYPIEHQGNAVADIDVTYRLRTSLIIDLNDYPDFMPMREDIEAFITNYPNQTDFWEVINRRLAESLLEKYPQLDALRIRLKIEALAANQPMSHKNYSRFSSVNITRPNGCPLNEQI